MEKQFWKTAADTYISQQQVNSTVHAWPINKRNNMQYTKHLMMAMAETVCPQSHAVMDFSQVCDHK